jgi:hypothetical protein
MISKAIAVDNSFTLQFVNTTNSVRTIELFQEGRENPLVAKGVNSFSNASYLVTYPSQPLVTWNAVYSTQPFYPFTPTTTTITQYPTADDIFWRTTGDLVLVSDNDLGGLNFSKILIPLVSGMTLAEVNNEIRVQISALSDLTNFKNIYGEVIQVNFFIDFNYLYKQTLPIPLINNLYVFSWGVSVQYPRRNLPIGSTGLPILLSKTFSPSSATQFFSEIEQATLVETSGANGVLLNSVNNVGYTQIAQSQNGSVIDIRSLALNPSTSPLESTIQSQMLQPFTFVKRNVNGNEDNFSKVPTIDPNQFQYSYASIDMNTEGEKYILDSNTRFQYKVEGLTSLNLTYNYVALPNLLFDRAYSLEKVQEEQLAMNFYQNEVDNATDRVISEILPPKKDEWFFPSTSKYNNFTNNDNIKAKKTIPLLIGISSILLIYYLSKKQRL